MAIYRNGKPIEEAEHDINEPERAEAMRRRHAEWAQTESDTFQSGSHRRCDTPRHWKHGKNLRV